MRTQAKRCTRKDLSYLAHWRAKGYALTIDDQIPLDTTTPPMPAAAKRRTIAGIVVGTLIIAGTLTMFGAWFGKAAGIY
jgi:hypothetical protein